MGKSMPHHWWENVGPSEPKITSWSCRELCCVKYVGQVSGLEKQECVKVWMRLSSISRGEDFVVMDGRDGVGGVVW